MNSRDNEMPFKENNSLDNRKVISKVRIQNYVVW